MLVSLAPQIRPLRRLVPARLRRAGRHLQPALHGTGSALRWAHAEATDSARPLVSRFERGFRLGSEATDFDRALAVLARRLRWQRTVQHAPRAVLVGAITALSLSLVARLMGLPGLAYLAIPFALVVAGLSVVVVARRSVGPFEVARRTDAALGLRERIATALELTETRAEGALVARQLEDARAALAHIDVSEAFPVFASGSPARRRAIRSGAWGIGALVAAFLLMLWPAASSQLLTARENALALADPHNRADDLLPRFAPPAGDMSSDEVEGMRGLTEQPDEFGDLQGLLGPQPNGQTSSAGPNAVQDARRDAADQQNPNVAERQQALQDLGNALRQSQTGRQAGDALRAGDTERANQQLRQLADQLNNLSPGERQSLASAFNQAAQQIGDKDRPLADAARKAADALSQFRNLEAQQAIREAAAQVRDTGQQLQAQRDLEDRQAQLNAGGQPNLPSLSQQGQAGGSQPGDQRSQQSTTRSDGAPSGAGGFDISQMESELQNGGLQAGTGGGGAGGGSGSGSQKDGAPTRLNVQGRTVSVDAEVRDGPSLFRPNSPNAPPIVMPPAAPPVPGAAPSSLQVNSGLDLNAVPHDLADPVRQYFTPDQSARP